LDSEDSELFKSTWELLDTPADSNSTSPSPHARRSSATFLSDCSSFDNVISSEDSYLDPSDHNGDFKSDVAEAVKHPVTAMRAAKDAFDLRQITNGIANVAEAASESIQDKLTHALDGQDLPAMHDKVMDMIPSVSMPTMQQVSRSLDVLSDSVMGMTGRGHSEAPFLEEILAGDHLSFAHHMGRKALRELVRNGICRPWQIERIGVALKWQPRIEEALMRLFIAEKKSFTPEQLFSMEPVWVVDAADKVWRLELDTDLMEVIVEADSDDCKERSVALDAKFSLPEQYGSVSIADVLRGVVAEKEDDWLAVEENQRD